MWCNLEINYFDSEAKIWPGMPRSLYFIDANCCQVLYIQVYSNHADVCFFLWVYFLCCLKSLFFLFQQVLVTHGAFNETTFGPNHENKAWTPNHYQCVVIPVIYMSCSIHVTWWFLDKPKIQRLWAEGNRNSSRPIWCSEIHMCGKQFAIW